MSQFLTADEALKVPNRRYGEVDVPELGGKLRLGSLSAEAALKMLELQQGKAEGGAVDPRVMMHFMLRHVCVDLAGDMLFTDEQATQLINRISMETVTDLVEKITAFVHEGLKNRKNSKASLSAA